MPERKDITDSSMFSGYSYDAESYVLLLDFKNGKTGKYAGVPAEKVEAFDQSFVDPKQSAGRFFSQQIKGKFDFLGYVGEEKDA